MTLPVIICEAGSHSGGWCNQECVPDGNTGAPVVKGIEGPASLNAGQTGTWTVIASVPNQAGAQLRYSVQWGDEGYYSERFNLGSFAYNQQTSATFTHAYPYSRNNGTYKPKFTVSNSYGSASAEMMVTVGTQSTTAYEQVKCVFIGATKEQRCYTASESSSSYYGLGCSGVGTCVVDLKGNKGDSITWKSSCGEYTRTTMDGSNEYANFICSDTSSSITVTAPNGGEQWEIGQLNTITWSPYGYNPDVNPSRDVSVYLERRASSEGGSFVTVGRVIETGKASLHTYFNIDSYDKFALPGEYSVRVVNNITGATDRSDAPFTLLPRAVDMKVNGSDGPLTLSDNQPITVTLTTNKVTSCTLTGVRGYSGGPVYQDSQVPMSGSVNSYSLHASTNGAITARCTGSDGGNRYDTVYVNPVVSATSLQITSPNGGEQFAPDKTNLIQWKKQGVSSVSIALYSNDQWYYWIKKDIPVTSENPDSVFTYVWNPSVAGTVAEGVQLGANVYKIYITGQKTDGSGYVDDKSDAPFGFVSNTTSVPNPVINAFYASPASISAGNSSTLSWNAGNAALCGISVISGDAPGLDLSKATTGGEGLTSVSTGTLNQSATYELRCAPLTGATGGYAIKSVTVTVNVQPTTTLAQFVNGSPCTTNSDCISGSCIPGMGVKWCTDKAYSCPHPGGPGVMVGASYSFGGSTYYCDAQQGLILQSTPSVDLRVNGSDTGVTIASGQGATYAWTSQNVFACTLTWTGSASGSLSMETSGSWQVPPYDGPASYTVTLTCKPTAGGASVSDSVTVKVGAPTASAATHQSANLANALTALETTLKALLQQLKR